MLIGATNKIISDIYLKLVNNKDIAKLLYYNNELDTDIDDLPEVQNPISRLKLKVFKNRRLQRLQREADIGITVNVYGKSNWKKGGHVFDKNIENLIEVGVCGHESCDDTINGSRVYAIMDLILNELDGEVLGSLGKIHFENMFQTKDLPIEYSGYLMYFKVFNIREEI